MAFNFFKKKKKSKDTKDSRYLQLKVSQVIRETEDAVSIEFEQPEGGLSYKPGQFITLILNVNGNKIRRAYSLSSSPYENELPTVTVKRVENGAMSNFVNNEVKAGDTIEVMEPMGSFTPEVSASNHKHYVLLAGGSGVTPLLSIAKSVLKEESNSKVSLVYANRDEASIIFAKTIAAKGEDDPRFKAIHFLEKAPENWGGYTGRFTTEALKEVVTNLGGVDDDNTVFYTCGPEPLMNVVMDTLVELKVPEGRRFKESFVAGNTSPKEIIADEKTSKSGDKEITIILDGEEHKYTVAPGRTILETGLDKNIDMPYSCQSGLCTACRGKCVSGKVKMDEDDGLSEEEKAEGYVLLCVGHPETDDVVIEIG